MSEPLVLRAWAPVRKLADARAWSPAPSPRARPCVCAKPLRTLKSFLCAARGWRMRGSSYSAPTALGVQCGRVTPLGTFTNAMRLGKPAGDAVEARATDASDGAIASSIGSATAAPRPRKNVRRCTCHLLLTSTNLRLRRTVQPLCYTTRLGPRCVGGREFRRPPHLERHAVDHAEHE